MYSKTNTAAFGIAIAAALFTFIFLDKLETTLLLEWFYLIIFLSIARFSLNQAYKKRRNNYNIHTWSNLYIYLSLLVSSAWGFAWFMVSDINDQFSMAVVGMFVFGISAAPFSSYIISLKALLMFFIPVTLLAMINYIYIGGENGYSFAFGIFLYAVVLLRSAFPVNKHIIDSVISKYRLEDEIIERKKVEDKLLELSIVDSLSGLYNRRHFDDTLNTTLHTSSRADVTTSLILIDVDNFKNYNDNYGHIDGDKCLRSICQSIKSSLKRAEDIAFRYGGEELAVILPNTQIKDALEIAERIRKDIQDLNIEHNYSSVENLKVISVSLGVACSLPSIDICASDLVDSADIALFKAKKSGKNRVSSS